MQDTRKPVEITDDAREGVGHLIEKRLPWLALGLLGGILTSVIVAKYQKILEADVRLAFFIPIIVYMSGAIGTQTETIYVRHLKKTGGSFSKYLLKETALGLALGAIFGLVVGFFGWFWLKSSDIGLAVGLAMFVNLTISPIVATFIPALLYREHSDPALGAGPISTVIQDLLSLLVYFLIAAAVLF